MKRLRKVLTGSLLVAAALALSVGAPQAQDDEAEEVFRNDISEPIVQSRCVNCHVAGGVSGHTRLVLTRSTEANHEAFNLRAFENLLDAVEDDGGVNYVLNKIQGVSHGGGVQVPAGVFGLYEHGVVPAAAGRRRRNGDSVLDAADAVRHGAVGAGPEDVAACRADLCRPPADGGRVRSGQGWGYAGTPVHDSRADGRAAVPRVPDPGEQRPAADGSGLVGHRRRCHR